MNIKRWSTVLVLTLLPLTACEPADQVPANGEAPFAEEEVPAGEPLTETPAAETPAAGNMITEQVTVTNPMPHAMIVMVTENGETRELGTVAANETAAFPVQAREGATINLSARDSADTHTVETTVTADGTPEDWTLGG